MSTFSYKRHSFISDNSARSSCIITCYNDNTIHNTTTIRIEDINFLTDSSSSSAIGCVKLLKSWSTEILSVNLNHKSYRLKTSDNLKLSIELVSLT